MEIVVGTYEELILGYKVIFSEGEYALEASFTDHSHTGCVKTVEVSPKGILASGSSDETIRLINLKNRKELGSLIQHEGSVTRLVFHTSGSHMFSSSEDGTICVWKTGSWECSRVLRGHKSHVYDITVHPSGKLALSISKDKTIRTWNLMTAKCAYVKVTNQVADLIMWSPDGNSYLVVMGNRIDFYNVQTAGVDTTIQCDFRIHSMVFMKEDLLAIGGEEGSVVFHNLKSKESVHKLSTNTNRVKDMAVCKCPEDDNITWLVTVSSDSFIKIWNVKDVKSKFSCSLVAETNTKFRLTSVALWKFSSQKATTVSDDKETTPADKATPENKHESNGKNKKRKETPQDQSKIAVSSKKQKVTVDEGKTKKRKKKKSLNKFRK